MSQVLEWSPPQEFHEYAILRRLGRGGMGQVYLARDTLLDRLVAIKFMLGYRDPAARLRFLREARAAARLQHHHVVAVYRIGELGECPYIVSEFIRGTPLSKVRKPMPWQRALEIGRGLASGLAAAHRAGVLHRDIKPANAVLGHDDRVKLLDFGLAKLEAFAELAEAAAPTGRSPSSDGHSCAPGDEPAREISDSASRAGRDEPASEPEHRVENGAGERPQIARIRAHTEDDTLQLGDEPAAASSTDDADRPIPSHADLDTLMLAAQQGGNNPAESKRVDPRDSTPRLSTMSEIRESSSHNSRPSQQLDGDDDVLTMQGVLMGTPYYMAPEIWRGEQATRRSDVYALGVVLYELMAGKPPHSDVEMTRLVQVSAELPAPPLADVADVDAGMASIVDRCLERDPANRFASALELWDALEESASGETTDSTLEGNPYRGLLPFDSEHRSVFFGRSRDIRAIVERLRSEQLLLVAGASGVGKSSVCRAGVWPAVTSGALGAERVWQLAVMVPSRRPLRALAAALAPHINESADRCADIARESSNDLRRRLVQALGQASGLIILIDQFEEMVTVSDSDEATVVSAVLADLADYAPGVRVLATAREDHLTRLARLPRLGELFSRALHWLQPLRADEIRETIVGPARATGVAFESDDLIEQLVESATQAQGGLPLLQFTLAQLWDARDPEHGITVAALAELGGVNGALARHADGVVHSLLVPERQAMRGILMRLVNLEGTRIRRTADELGADDRDGRAALEAMVRSRLLVAREDEGETVYEIAHEALLSGWPTLQRWLDTEADIRAERARVVAAAAEWHSLERNRDLLWRHGQLARVRQLSLADLPASAADFLSASRRAARRRRWLLVGLLAVAVSVVAGVYVGTRVVAQRALDRKVDARVGSARALVERARAANAEVEALREQAFALFDRKDKEAGEEIWTHVRAGSSEVNRLYAEASQDMEAALGLDAERHHLRAFMAEILYERALLAERDSLRAQMDELLQRLTVYDDHQVWQSRWTAPAFVQLQTQPTGARVSIEQYVGTLNDSLRTEPKKELGVTPLSDIRLLPGSYVFILDKPGMAAVRYPVRVTRDEQLALGIDLIPVDAVPSGFAYIPHGRFLFGTNNEAVREFWETTPLYERHTDAYLIAKTETTFGQWIAFLRALPADERGLWLPKSTLPGRGGDFELRERDGGRWELVMEPYRALDGQPIVYSQREHRASQNWLRFPVTGVSWEDALVYVRWLDTQGIVKGARMCREDEWERAARGADARLFAHGGALGIGDANLDRTYERNPLSYGPDEVGSYSHVQSPFGLLDTNGNAYEQTASVLEADGIQARGGSYAFNLPVATVSNRAPWVAQWREASVGFRVCADIASAAE